MVTIYRDRADAGNKLWYKLNKYIDDNTSILAVPHGGVVVADVICKKSNLPIDIIIPKKIRAPYDNNHIIGALAEDDIYVINEEDVAYSDITESKIDEELRYQVEEINKMRSIYNKIEKPNMIDKNVIVIDDVIATGMTLLAVLRYLEYYKAKSIIISAPIVTREAVYLLENNGAIVIYDTLSKGFNEANSYYNYLMPVSDAEITKILSSYNTNLP